MLQEEHPRKFALINWSSITCRVLRIEETITDIIYESQHTIISFKVKFRDIQMI